MSTSTSNEATGVYRATQSSSVVTPEMSGTPRSAPALMSQTQFIQDQSPFVTKPAVMPNSSGYQAPPHGPSSTTVPYPQRQQVQHQDSHRNLESQSHPIIPISTQQFYRPQHQSFSNGQLYSPISATSSSRPVSAQATSTPSSQTTLSPNTRELIAGHTKALLDPAKHYLDELWQSIFQSTESEFQRIHLCFMAEADKTMHAVRAGQMQQDANRQLLAELQALREENTRRAAEHTKVLGEAESLKYVNRRLLEEVHKLREEVRLLTGSAGWGANSNRVAEERTMGQVVVDLERRPAEEGSVLDTIRPEVTRIIEDHLKCILAGARAHQKAQIESDSSSPVKLQDRVVSTQATNEGLPPPVESSPSATDAVSSSTALSRSPLSMPRTTEDSHTAVASTPANTERTGSPMNMDISVKQENENGGALSLDSSTWDREVIDLTGILDSPPQRPSLFGMGAQSKEGANSIVEASTQDNTSGSASRNDVENSSEREPSPMVESSDRPRKRRRTSVEVPGSLAGAREGDLGVSIFDELPQHTVHANPSLVRSESVSRAETGEEPVKDPDDVQSNPPVVKMEQLEDEIRLARLTQTQKQICSLSDPPPPEQHWHASNGLNSDQLAVIYHTADDRVYCRVCLLRLKTDPDYPATSYSLHTSSAELSGHCETKHSTVYDDLARMSSAQLAEMRKNVMSKSLG